mgnify:FL=1
MIIDTHCHLNDDAFEDREDIIANLKNNNIKSAFVVGTDLQTSIFAIELAKKHSNLFAIVGMYPEYCQQYDKKFEQFLMENATDPKVVAIGEIGLDYHTDGFDKEKQKEVLLRQLEIAHKFNLPLSIHVRDAFEDLLNIFESHKDLLSSGGVIHCFSGSPEIARRFVKLGFKLGFGGVCTFKNARKVVDTLKQIDESQILLETDAPYLAPEPFRGKRNEPKFTNIVLDKICEIRGQDRNYLEQKILQNTKEVFKKYRD